MRTELMCRVLCSAAASHDVGSTVSSQSKKTTGDGCMSLARVALEGDCAGARASILSSGILVPPGVRLAFRKVGEFRICARSRAARTSSSSPCRTLTSRAFGRMCCRLRNMDCEFGAAPQPSISSSIPWTPRFGLFGAMFRLSGVGGVLDERPCTSFALRLAFGVRGVLESVVPRKRGSRSLVVRGLCAPVPALAACSKGRRKKEMPSKYPCGLSGQSNAALPNVEGRKILTPARRQSRFREGPSSLSVSGHRDPAKHMKLRTPNPIQAKLP